METIDKNTPVKREATQSSPSIYANNAEINVTTWDFRFRFGEIETLSPQAITVAERVRVVMSPQHAKVFSRVLAENIAKYEQAFGEIAVEGLEDAKEKKTTQ